MSVSCYVYNRIQFHLPLYDNCNPTFTSHLAVLRAICVISANSLPHLEPCKVNPCVYFTFLRQFCLNSLKVRLSKLFPSRLQRRVYSPSFPPQFPLPLPSPTQKWRQTNSHAFAGLIWRCAIVNYCGGMPNKATNKSVGQDKQSG